jgi:hypothetical protein
MSTLNNLAEEHGTDKSSDIHNYCVKYEKYLPFNRYDKLNILEIGVLNGKSLLTWKDYFYRSNILGIDINPDCKKYEEPRISVEIGSQFDKNFLFLTANQYGPFDMILDDGSHINEHVIFSFKQLWGSVKSGGVYVIEDIGTSYWKEYGGGFREPQTSMEYFKKLADDVNFRGVINFNKPNVHGRREDWCEENIKNEQPDCRTDIESITFLNGIIIITKR